MGWHADYKDASIITSEEKANATLKAILDIYGQSIEPKDALQIEREITKLNYIPTVELTEEYALVRMIVFSKWTGFYEVVATISRNFPHIILGWEENIKIEYSIGIVL